MCNKNLKILKFIVIFVSTFKPIYSITFDDILTAVDTRDSITKAIVIIDMRKIDSINAVLPLYVCEFEKGPGDSATQSFYITDLYFSI
jgi:hypothetical protein